MARYYEEKTATIYEDEHAQVAVLPGGEDAAPVVVNTADTAADTGNALLDTAREALLMPEIQDVEEDED